jgi:glutathione S-transferase
MGMRLYQFLASHFNEKARWTLDLKRAPHERITLLPGPHVPKVKRLTGQTATPVLVDGDEVITGSARIVDHLERRFPERALYPQDGVARERALAIQAEFDAEVGPAVRLAKFFEVLDADWMVGTFCREASPTARAFYRAAFPLISRVMRSSMAIDAANAERARTRVRAALDFVAANAGTDGYLVGDSFSVADLACAALLMPTVRVAEWGGPTEHDSDRNRRWLAHWSAHPGAEWVRSTYRRHRVP